MNKKIKLKNEAKLKKLKKDIEEATKKKQLEIIEDEIKELEEEIISWSDTLLKEQLLRKLRLIKTSSEIFHLQKEVKALKQETDQRKEELEEKKEEIKDKDKKQDEYQELLAELDKTKDEFKKSIEEMLKKKEDIRNKVSKDIETIETVEVIKKRQSVLLDTLLLIYLLKSNMDPKIKIPLTLLLISDISDKLQEKEETIVHIEYHYEDAQKIIDEAMDSIEDIEKEMAASLKDIDDWIKDFEKDFEAFRFTKEYQEIKNAFYTIEKAIKKEYEGVKDIEKDLQQSKSENQDKVLKLENN